MDSNYIKACLSAYYRFGKGCHWIATECGRFSSDFLAIRNNKLIEVEIKTSKADLNADFKKPKHRIYEAKSSKYVPNYFYFCVPEDLVEYAAAKCVDKPYGILQALENTEMVKRKWPAWDEKDIERVTKMLNKRYEKFKLLKVEKQENNTRRNYCYDVYFECLMFLPFKERIKVVNRAKLMHSSRPDRRVQYQILSRLSSEMANLRINQVINKKASS